MEDRLAKEIPMHSIITLLVYRSGLELSLMNQNQRNTTNSRPIREMPSANLATGFVGSTVLESNGMNLKLWHIIGW
jgi:hypothetical protein